MWITLDLAQVLPDDVENVRFVDFGELQKWPRWRAWVIDLFECLAAKRQRLFVFGLDDMRLCAELLVDGVRLVRANPRLIAVAAHLNRCRHCSRPLQQLTAFAATKLT